MNISDNDQRNSIEKISISRSQWFDAARQEGLDEDAQAALWSRMSSISGYSGPAFGMTTALYYFGGMIAIGAMSLFMTLSWDAFGAIGLLAITMANIAALFVAADRLGSKGFSVPAGIMATLAVVLVPLASWCALNGLGLFPEGARLSRQFSDFHQYIDWRWASMEIATLLAGALALRRFRLPFMVMPVAVTLWYMSMDFVSFFTGESLLSWHDGHRSVSMAFGVATLALATWVDLRCRLAASSKDFPFWLYIFGTGMFWGALSLTESSSELGKAIYCAINAAMVFYGAAVGRRVFTVFGGLGVAGYLGHLASAVFGSNLGFSFCLMGIGLAIVMAGVWWQKNERELQARLSEALPSFLAPLSR